MDTLWQDIRYGARMLVKRPAFTAIVIVALALGIGANSAIFSVANAVLFRPLPYENPEQLVMIWETNQSRGYDDSGCSPPDFREWRARNQAFEQMAAFNSNAFNLTGTDDPERVPGVEVSPALFSTLGVSPVMGRAFVPEEEEFGRHRVVILSDGLWRRRFGADPNVLGKTVKLNGEEYQIVGVMPQTFQHPDARTALWIPMSFAPNHFLNTRGNHYLNVVARLKPGVTLEQAQADMTSIATRLEQEFKENAGLGTRVVTLRSEVVGSVEPALLVLLGAVAFVLLIACANVANLLLARSAARQREIAIRTTLGASRLRIVRQLLTESIMLSLVGGMLGLLLALWGVDVLVSIGPEDIPRLSEIGVDARALIFTFGLSLLTGIIFGLVPALQTSKPDLNESLKEGSRGTTTGIGSRRIRGALVIAEVALSLVLLVGAGLMIRSFLALQSVDPGFNPENVLTMAIALPASKYPDAQPEQRAAFFNQLTERIKSLPGVTSVGTITALPLSRSSWGKLFSREDRPPATSLEEVPLVQYRQIAGDYFSSMGIPLLKGRFIDERDGSQSQKVALINETLARRFFPDEDPIGKVIYLGPPLNLIDSTNLPPGFDFPRLTIVGIVKDVKHTGLSQAVSPEVYNPHQQAQGIEISRSMFVAVRTTGDPLSLVGAVKSQVAAIDRDQPIASISTMQERLRGSLSQPRFNTLLLGIFASVAMILAAVGIYGVMAYSVTQRTHEIGVRMALGARQSDVLRMVIGQGLALTVAGIAIGLVAALLMTRLMESLLFGVSATDPLTFALIAFLLGSVAVVASYIPARRAMKVDPMVALRYE